MMRLLFRKYVMLGGWLISVSGGDCSRPTEPEQATPNSLLSSKTMASYFTPERATSAVTVPVEAGTEVPFPIEATSEPLSAEHSICEIVERVQLTSGAAVPDQATIEPVKVPQHAPSCPPARKACEASVPVQAMRSASLPKKERWDGVVLQELILDANAKANGSDALFNPHFRMMHFLQSANDLFKVSFYTP
jgi:hypothetical protein